MTRIRRGVAGNATIALLLLTLVGSACGGGATSSPTPSPTVAATLSVNPPRTATAEPTEAPTPAPAPAPVLWPLTGLVADDPEKVRRRPLNVRLPNDRSARPHVGLARADLVFEMIVEGGITRYAAIYHSQDVGGVGPVRSYRFSDLHLTQMLRGALVASGATVEEVDAATRSIEAGNMISVDAQRGYGFYYRVPGRPGPNDLFADLTAARQAVNDAGGKDPVEVPPLAFFPPGGREPASGGIATTVPASSVVIPFNDPATFTWDAGPGAYRRSQGGLMTADTAPGGAATEPLAIANVVVMWTDIWETGVVQDRFGSLGLDYRTTDGGRAAVFRDGLRVDGTWKRDSVLDMFTFYDQGGEQILLAPGQTWMHFVYQDWVVTSAP